MVDDEQPMEGVLPISIIDDEQPMEGVLPISIIDDAPGEGVLPVSITDGAPGEGVLPAPVTDSNPSEGVLPTHTNSDSGNSHGGSDNVLPDTGEKQSLIPAALAFLTGIGLLKKKKDKEPKDSK